MLTAPRFQLANLFNNHRLPTSGKPSQPASMPSSDRFTPRFGKLQTGSQKNPDLLNFVQQEYQTMFRRYREQFLTKRLPEETFVKSLKELASFDALGLRLPTEHGGAGVDKLSYILALEETAKASPETAINLLIHNTLAAGTLKRFTGESARAKWLPGFSTGMHITTAHLEPGKLTATQDGHDFLINGKLSNLPMGNGARAFLVSADTRLGFTQKATQGLFMLEASAPGVTIRPKKLKTLPGLGWADVTFKNVRIPYANLLAKGKFQNPDIQNESRLASAAILLGMAQAQKPAKPDKDILATRILIYHAARLLDKKLPATQEIDLALEAAQKIAPKTPNTHWLNHSNLTAPY